jgi:hypothetical protein
MHCNHKQGRFSQARPMGQVGNMFIHTRRLTLGASSEVFGLKENSLDATFQFWQQEME